MENLLELDEWLKRGFMQYKFSGSDRKMDIFLLLGSVIDLL